MDKFPCTTSRLLQPQHSKQQTSRCWCPNHSCLDSTGYKPHAERGWRRRWV